MKLTSKMSTSNNIRYARMAKHLFDHSEMNVYDKSITNLSVGAPGTDLLKKACELFQKATKHRTDIEFSNDAYFFQYGAAIGNKEARNELASFLTFNYKDKVHSDDLVLTSGATNGLHLILSTLVDMNGVIFVDEITYMIALEAFAQFTNMKVIGVKFNNNGVDVEDLRKNLTNYKFVSKHKMFWGMYYTIPTFHNPTGIIFSKEICKELIKLARKFDILIVADDVYNLLHYTTETVPTRLYACDNMNDHDYKGNVISNGSFSKIIAPGIRLGWMECPPKCVEAFDKSGILNSGGAVNNYTSGIVTSLIQMGLAQSHINMMASNYKKRMITTCNILESYLPSECSFQKPDGGYFIWITLPENCDATLFNKYCLEKYKIFAIVGDRFSISGKFKNCLRITIAFHSEEILRNAAKLLCTAINEFCR